MRAALGLIALLPMLSACGGGEDSALILDLPGTFFVDPTRTYSGPGLFVENEGTDAQAVRHGKITIRLAALFGRQR